MCAQIRETSEKRPAFNEFSSGVSRKVFIVRRVFIDNFKMLMMLCTLFIHINLIAIRQKIQLKITEYYSVHNIM